MRCQRLAFDLVNQGGVHKSAGQDAAPQTITQTVWHRVIHRHFVISGGPCRYGFEIAHSAREGGGDGEPAGVGVVLHVILRGMGEEDIGLHVADDGGQGAQQFEVVKDLQIVSNG